MRAVYSKVGSWWQLIPDFDNSLGKELTTSTTIAV